MKTKIRVGYATAGRRNHKVRKTRKHSMKEICSRFHLAGVQYSDYQKATNLRVDAPLTAVWERTNKFDDRAIAIYCDEVRIGYVPKADEAQSIMHEYREAGIKLHATCIAFNKTNNTWNMITVKVEAERLLDEEGGNEEQKEF
jgi:hypothetical protein